MKRQRLDSERSPEDTDPPLNFSNMFPKKRASTNANCLISVLSPRRSARLIEKHDKDPWCKKTEAMEDTSDLGSSIKTSIEYSMLSDDLSTLSIEDVMEYEVDFIEHDNYLALVPRYRNSTEIKFTSGYLGILEYKSIQISSSFKKVLLLVKTIWEKFKVYKGNEFYTRGAAENGFAVFLAGDGDFLVTEELQDEISGVVGGDRYGKVELGDEGGNVVVTFPEGCADHITNVGMTLDWGFFDGKVNASPIITLRPHATWRKKITIKVLIPDYDAIIQEQPKAKFVVLHVHEDQKVKVVKHQLERAEEGKTFVVFDVRKFSYFRVILENFISMKQIFYPKKPKRVKFIASLSGYTEKFALEIFVIENEETETTGVPSYCHIVGEYRGRFNIRGQKSISVELKGLFGADLEVGEEEELRKVVKLGEGSKSLQWSLRYLQAQGEWLPGPFGKVFIQTTDGEILGEFNLVKQENPLQALILTLFTLDILKTQLKASPHFLRLAYDNFGNPSPFPDESDNECDQIIEKDLWSLASTLTNVNWKILARGLSLPESVLIDIEENHKTNRERCHNVLIEWKERNPQEFRGKTLRELLKREGYELTAKKIV